MQILNNNVDSCGYDDESFADLIQEVAPSQREERAKSAKGSNTQNGPRPEFTGIVQGCAFVLYWQEEARRLREDEWYAGMSIVGRCQDGEALAHEISSKDPRYDPAETDRKLRHALESAGPRTCRNIEEGLGFEGCASCPHHGRIKSPIQLGRSAGSQPLTLLEHLHKLNEQYAVVLVGGRCLVLKEIVDPLTQYPDIVLLSTSDFYALHANKKVPVPSGTGTRMVPLAKVWLEWQGRREYDGIVFDPSGETT